MSAPVKKVAKKAPVKRVFDGLTKDDAGHPLYDWRGIYKSDVSLFKYTSADGFVVCLPSYEDPGEGEVFGLMLMNKSETDLLIYVMRQHITENAIDAEVALQATFRALQRMKRPGVIEELLQKWPEASGKQLAK